MVCGLAVIALWLWMARANGQGRNWARILSTALFGLAALELIKAYPGNNLGHFVLGGQVQPVIHYRSGVTALALIVPALTLLAGLAAMWLLWRPASSAFFKPQNLTQTGHSAYPSTGRSDVTLPTAYLGCRRLLMWPGAASTIVGCAGTTGLLTLASSA
jgi:hypothetical protein